MLPVRVWASFGDNRERTILNRSERLRETILRLEVLILVNDRFRDRVLSAHLTCGQKVERVEEVRLDESSHVILKERNVRVGNVDGDDDASGAVVHLIRQCS